MEGVHMLKDNSQAMVTKNRSERCIYHDPSSSSGYLRFQTSQWLQFILYSYEECEVEITLAPTTNNPIYIYIAGRLKWRSHAVI